MLSYKYILNHNNENLRSVVLFFDFLKTNSDMKKWALLPRRDQEYWRAWCCSSYILHISLQIPSREAMSPIGTESNSFQMRQRQFFQFLKYLYRWRWKRKIEILCFMITYHMNLTWQICFAAEIRKIKQGKQHIL